MHIARKDALGPYFARYLHNASAAAAEDGSLPECDSGRKNAAWKSST